LDAKLVKNPQNGKHFIVNSHKTPNFVVKRQTLITKRPDVSLPRIARIARIGYAHPDKDKFVKLV